MELISLEEMKNLPETTAKKLQFEFNKYLDQISDWELKAKQIVVFSSEQKEEMQEARQARLHLVKVRSAIEKRRKELKEDGLREGQAIDGIANTLKGLIMPIEKYLESQETFAKREEEQRKALLQEKRVLELKRFEVDCTFFDLANMPDAQYERLLHTSEMDYLAKIERENELKRQQIELEHRQKKLNERLDILNPFMKYYTPELDYYIPLNVNTDEEQWQTIMNLAAKSKNEFIEKEARLKAENEKLRFEMAERDRLNALERQRLEDELRAKRMEEEAIKSKELAKQRQLEEERKEEERKQKEINKASDAVKIEAMRNSIIMIAKQAVNTIMQFSFKSEEGRREQKELYDLFYKLIPVDMKPNTKVPEKVKPDFGELI